MVSFRLVKLSGSLALCFGLLSGPASATAQYNQWISVDCSLTAPAPPTYQSITAALSALTDNSAISVAPGTVCNESVNLSDFSHIGIFTDLGKTFTLAGNLSIQNSRSVYIYGVNVTNPSGDGIDVNNSDAVTIEDSSSSNNSGTGLSINASNVTVNHVGSFDYNLGGGVNVNLNSSLNFSGWWPLNAHFELNGNSGWGLRMDRSIVEFSGSTTISNTVASVGGTFPDGFGIAGWGGAKGFLLAMTGANLVTGNQGGGIFLAETSEISIGGGYSWAPYTVTLQGNGPFGAFLEFGGQMSVVGATQVTDHTIAGLDLCSGSQATLYNNNVIAHNGTGLDPGRAGLRVDGNSQAYVRATTFNGNGGPGILALVNSSVDLGTSSFIGNMGGTVVCDGSAVVKSDLSSAMLGSGNACRIPAANSIQRHISAGPPSLSNQAQWKAYVNKMHAFMATHHR